MLRFIQKSPSLFMTVSLSLLLLLLGLTASVTETPLQYDREAIIAGEVWRLLTGQLVHYGFYHLLMNNAALLLCGYVLLRDLSARSYGLLLAVSGISVGLGLFYLDSSLVFYAGLSGVLHGLIIAGLVLGFRAAPWFYTLALLAVIGKLVHEQMPDFDTSHPLLPVPVAVNAHLYGALGGLLWAMMHNAIITFRKKSHD